MLHKKQSKETLKNKKYIDDEMIHFGAENGPVGWRGLNLQMLVEDNPMRPTAAKESVRVYRTCFFPRQFWSLLQGLVLFCSTFFLQKRSLVIVIFTRPSLFSVLSPHVWKALISPHYTNFCTINRKGERLKLIKANRTNYACWVHSYTYMHVQTLT